MMRYPKFLDWVNRTTAVIGGVMIVVIGLLATMEGILRGFFSNPTFWSLDISQFLLIWTIFLGTACAFQDKSHVSVDMVKEFVGQHWGSQARRVLIIIGYIFALVFILVLGWDSYALIVDALELEILTMGNVQIPIVYLYTAMLVGSVLMIITVICIILDLVSGSDRFL